MNVYSLINENNEWLSLSNFKETALIPSFYGVGYEHDETYVRVGNSYRLENREIKQGQLSGRIVFKEYSKYLELIEYLEDSESLRLIYKPIDTEYYRDVIFQGITGVVVKGAVVECDINFNCKGLYYTQDDRRFTLEAIEGESRWPLPFPFTFNDYSNISITYNNRGHTDSEFVVEIYGYTEKPELKLFIDGVLKYKVSFNVTIQEGEKLLYSAKDGNNYVAIQRADGSQEYIPNCLNLESDNFFKIPKGQSVLKVSTDSGVRNKVVFSILTAYKGV